MKDSQMIATAKREQEGNFVRAVLVVHEIPAREVHASPWCQTGERAFSHVARYAKKNRITIAYSDFGMVPS